MHFIDGISVLIYIFQRTNLMQNVKFYSNQEHRHYLRGGDELNIFVLKVTSILRFSLLGSIRKTKLTKQKMPSLAAKAPTSHPNPLLQYVKGVKENNFQLESAALPRVFTFIGWYIDLKSARLATSHYKSTFCNYLFN